MNVTVPIIYLFHASINSTNFFYLKSRFDIPHLAFLGISGIKDSVFPLATVNGIYKYAFENGANWQNFNLNGGHTTTIDNRDSIGYLFDKLASKTRNPFPNKIEWETDNVQNGRNLWIEILELDTFGKTDYCKYNSANNRIEKNETDKNFSTLLLQFHY